ncbi:MAG TPA: PAS domain S-box protein [Bacteroidia bacterium]|nr:PAS domain S-box protein [Bacteroidia bacterium]
MNTYSEIKILLVEDDEDDYFLFRNYLGDIKIGKYALTWASTYEKAVLEIRKKEHDIYFFDYMLGSHNGLDLIKECIMMGIDAPIILLTGLGNHKTDLAAMEFGAADYLMKSEIDAEKLERSIRYSIEQSKSLKKVKDSEEKFRSIFENSHDVIYLADSSGKIYEINKAAERLFGYNREEILNMNAVDFYENKQDRAKFLEAINQTGTYSNYEVTLKDKYGNRKFCMLTASVQKVDESGVVYYQGIVHDITRRRKAEQDLQIAEKLAVTGRVARTLAHEVRNPLTNINLSVEQLEEDIKAREYQTYFEIIKRNSKRINDLITELMENSKPTEIKSSKIPVHTIIDKTISLAKDRAALRNIKIETEFIGDHELIQGDESKLTMAFLNIITNAIEAVEDNKGVIKILTHCKDKKCLIEIEDNGCGICKDDLAKIFEPYFTGKSNGMGLGLATTHNIIRTHKGYIDVESEEGKGTKFSINLNLI